MADNNRNIGRTPGLRGTVDDLDLERNRDNYRYRVEIGEEKVKKLRTYAYRMVYRYTREEMLGLLASYGEIRLVKNQNDIEEIRRQLVETLLVNLTESELNQIVQNVNQQTKKLINIIGQYNKKADARMAGYTNTPSPNVIVQKPTNTNRFTQIAKTFDKSALFSPNYKLSSKIAVGLRRELEQVLDTMNLADIAGFAANMGYDMENPKIDAMRDFIIDQVASVVILATGKNTGKTVIAIPDADAFEVAKTLLAKTSWAWVVGAKTLSAAEIKALREKAKQARKKMEARNKLLTTNGAKTNSTAFAKVAGVSGRNRDKISRRLETNDQGFMRDWSFERVAIKAAELGIDYNPRKTTIGELKMAVYQKIAGTIKTENKLRKQLYKSQKNLGRTNKEGFNTLQEERVRTDAQTSLDTFRSVKDSIIKDASIITPSTVKGEIVGDSTDTLVKFDENGKIKNRVFAAQAVYIVGQGSISQMNADYKKNNPEKDSGDDSRSAILRKLLTDPKFANKYVTAGITRKAQKMVNKEERNSRKTEYKDYKSLQKNINKFYKNISKQYRDAYDSFLSTIMSDEYRDKYGNELVNIATDVENKYNKFINELSSSEDNKDFEINSNKITSLIDNLYNADDRYKKNLHMITNVSDNGGDQTDSSDGTENNKEKKFANFLQASFNDPKFDKEIIYSTTPVWIMNPKDITGHSKASNGENKESKEIIDSLISLPTIKAKDHNDNSLGILDNWWKANGENIHWNKEKSDDKDLFNTAGKRLFRCIKRGFVTPVWIANGYTEYLNNTVSSGFEDLTNVDSQIYNYLSTTMPMLFAGLQQAGLSFNMASVASAAATAIETLKQFSQIALDKIGTVDANKNIVKYATGGYGQSPASANMTQFISGDSTNGKENKELVSIDWDKQTYQVKPSGNATSQQMTSEERHQSFGISFNEAKVKYDEKIYGETDDNVALKVYPVTPGINDTVSINGNDVSLMQLMLGMYQSVYSIENMMTTNVEVAKMIAANTSKIGIGSGQTTSSGDSSFNLFPTNTDSIMRGE